MTDPLSDKDHNDALMSLRAWFISQDIQPPDAGPIMVQLIAELFVAKTQKLEELSGMITDFSNLLTFKISQYLESKQEPLQ